MAKGGVHIEKVNIPGIDTEKGIHNSGNFELFTETLGEVYEIIDEKCASVKEHLAQGDIKAFTTEVHALKTDCRMIGAMELSENFYMLEKYGDENNKEKLEEYTSGVLESLSALKVYLEPYRVKKAVADREYDRNTVMETLEKLSAAIGEFDLTAAEACIKKLETYRYEGELSVSISRLAALVTDLDYEEAAKLTLAIRDML